MDGILGCNSLLSSITSSWKFLKASYALGLRGGQSAQFTLTGDYVVAVITGPMTGYFNLLYIPIVLPSEDSFVGSVYIDDNVKVGIRLENKIISLTAVKDTQQTYVSIFEFTK